MSATLTTVELEEEIFGVAYKDIDRLEFKQSAKFRATNGAWNHKIHCDCFRAWRQGKSKLCDGNGKFEVAHNSRSNVGSVMQFIGDLPKGSTLDNWFDHYFDSWGGDRIWNSIAAWQDDLGSTWRFAVNSYFIYVIDNTFKGLDGENRALELLNADPRWRGYLFRHGTEHEDVDCGVDIAGTKQRRIEVGIQAKPQSYAGNNISDAQRQVREVVNPKKYELFRKENPGAQVFYVNTDTLPTKLGERVKLLRVEDIHLGWSAAR